MSKHPLYNETGLQKDNKPQVLYALVNKRAEIDGKIIALKKELFKLECDLNAIDQSITIFDPNLDIEIKPKMPKKETMYFPHKKVKVAIIKLLKNSESALEITFIHESIAKEFDINIVHKHNRYTFKNRVGNILSTLLKDGYLEKNKFKNKVYYIVNKESKDILLDSKFL